MSRSRPARGELLAGDRVGLAQDVEALAGDLADDPDAEAGAGERVPPDDLGRQAELLADQPDLVLEQRAQRLDQLELEVVGQAADVVVGLDVGGAGAAAGLDDVGVERALHEERDRAAASAASPTISRLGGLEDPDELAADDLALLLRVGDPGERVEELLRRRRRRRGRRRSRPRSRARPARSRPCASARGRRRRRSAGRRSRAARARRRPRSRRRRRGRRSPGASPTCARIRSTCSSTMLTIVQVWRQPAMSSRKCSSTCWPCSVCSTSGCHCTPARPPVDVLERRDRGDPSVEARTSKPGGRRGHGVAVGHPHGVLGREVGEQGAGRGRP